MNIKQAVVTAAISMAMLAVLNQFDQTQKLLNGSNRYFS